MKRQWKRYWSPCDGSRSMAPPPTVCRPQGIGRAANAIPTLLLPYGPTASVIRRWRPRPGRGRKTEVENSEHSSEGHLTDDEELALPLEEVCVNQDVPDTRCSSSEDWDSDDYWIPHYYKPPSPPVRSRWLAFVKKKMEEGNFCPMDAHQVSIADLVKYENHCNPRVIEEVEGQFDDYSGDES